MSASVLQSRSLVMPSNAARTLSPTLGTCPSVITRQPQNNLKINWSNPISRGLIFCLLPFSLINLVDGKIPSLFSPVVGPSKIAGPGGMARGFSSGLNYWSVPAFSKEFSTLHIWTAPSGVIELDFSAKSSATGDGYTMFSAHSGSNTYTATQSVSGGTPEFSTPQSTKTIGGANRGGTSATYAMTANGTTSIVYTDYITTSASITNNIDNIDTLGYFVLGGLLGSSDTGYGTPPTHLGLAWNRAISSSDMFSVIANPWQLFAPSPVKQIWTPN